MALVKCHECGTEISTETKTCPKCGARNKKRKTSKIIKFGGTLVAVFVLYVIYLSFEHELKGDIPTCESSHGRKVFIGTFENGRYAQNNKLRVIDVTDQREVSAGSRPEGRVCEVTFRLNDGTKETYVFSFDAAKNGGYIVRGKQK